MNQRISTGKRFWQRGLFPGPLWGIFLFPVCCSAIVIFPAASAIGSPGDGGAPSSRGIPRSSGDNGSYNYDGAYYEHLLEHMREEHPALAGERMKSSAFKMAARSSTSAYPDPEISVSRSRSDSKNAVYFMTPGYMVETGNGIDYRLTQPIPFPGKLTLKAKAAGVESDLAGVRYSIEANNLAGRFLANLIEARRLRETLEQTKAFVDKVAILSDVAEMRYRTDRGSLSDVSRGRLKVSLFSERIRDLEGRLIAKKRELRYYLESSAPGEPPSKEAASGVAEPDRRDRSGLHLNSDPEVAIERLISGEDFFAFMERMRERASSISRPPDLSLERKASDLEEKRREYMQDSARMDYLPDFAVFAGYGRREFQKNYTDITRGHEETYSLGVTLRIPLWSAFSNTYKLKEQDRMQSAAKLSSLDVREKVDSLYNATMLELEANRDRLRLYESSLIPAAQITSDSSKLAYEAGKVDFSALLDSYDALYQVRIDRVQLHSEYYGAILTMAGLVDRIYASGSDGAGDSGNDPGNRDSMEKGLRGERNRTVGSVPLSQRGGQP